PTAGSADTVVVRLAVTPADPACPVRRADVLRNGQRVDLPPAQVTAVGPAGVCSFCGRPVTIQAADTPNGATVFTLTLPAAAESVTLTAAAWDMQNRRGEALPRELRR
ncbi:MAG: hypothetical protein HYU66_16220, partial [Armatimonadetes bacterium]|nr:hypothetical protein [Armatimonadota bacterium]